MSRRIFTGRRAKGRFPGVLLPCGHSANGKAYSSYQKACILLAQHGFVVLCFDPLGQGERRQLIGDQPQQTSPPRSEHNPLSVAPMLLGRSLAAMMVWDGMRGIDYLCSRPEVDAERIGCTGISGGGNLTSYLMAFDERIVAAAPGCFMTTHRHKNEFPGPGDAEQNLHAQIRDGFDHPDFIVSRAPQPTLILAATQDYVPIAGTWGAFRQGKRAYTLLGYPERIQLLETNDKHGFTKRMREGVVRFMARWLQGRLVEVFEEDDVPILSDEHLQVTPHGQVRWLPGARSTFDLYTEAEQELAAKRPPLTAKVVREATGIRPLKELPKPQVEILRSEVRETSGSDREQTVTNPMEPNKLIIRPEPGILLPALHWPDGARSPILIAPAEGMNSAVGQARRWHAQGHPVLIVDVRDLGETGTRNWRFPGADSFIGLMLGRSWLTMRAEDLLISARLLAESSEQKQVDLHATGETTPAALHAAFLEPDLIGDVQTTDGLASWQELMTSRDAYSHIHQVVYGALRSYDLPDLRQKANETQARLYRRIQIPAKFLTTKQGHTFGGDLRIGDFNGDGQCDFLVYRCNHGAPKGAHRGGMKPAFIGAFDLEGTALWQAGEDGNHPSRPMSVAVKDWTGDGADDVICFWHRPIKDSKSDWQSLADVVVQLRDGRSGDVLREAAPQAITERRLKDPIGANWVHQRLLIANFRGTPEPHDIAVKLGDTYVALDEDFSVLWTYRSEWVKYSQCPAYIPAVGDIDSDGRDELLTGYHLIDDDGSLMWKNKLGDNMDSVTIDRWQGATRAICSGFGHVLTADGQVVLALGRELVPHGQEVRVADFHSGYAGNEMVLRAYGHQEKVHLVSSQSNKIIHTIELQSSPTNVGMEPVYWNGPDKPAFLFNGGWLWDMQQGTGRQLPNLPPPNGGKVHRMGFYHAIPANLCCDDREELVLWDPTATEVFVYTPQPSGDSAYSGYQAGSRQYNPRIMD